MNRRRQHMMVQASWLLAVAMAGAGGWAFAAMMRPDNLLQFLTMLTLC